MKHKRFYGRGEKMRLVVEIEGEMEMIDEILKGRTVQLYKYFSEDSPSIFIKEVREAGETNE